MLPFELTKDTPYLALSGELWSVFYEYFNRNWPCYKGFLLYLDIWSVPLAVLPGLSYRMECSIGVIKLASLETQEECRERLLEEEQNRHYGMDPTSIWTRFFLVWNFGYGERWPSEFNIEIKGMAFRTHVFPVVKNLYCFFFHGPIFFVQEPIFF